MDTRTSPFGNHPDGGKISQLEEGKLIPEHMMPLSSEAIEVLDKIPQQERVNFVLHSDDPKLADARKWLEDKLRQKAEADFIKRILHSKEK